ncbi:MAG: sigma-70 family RNA polymerase sigma factor [Anaerolineales bacterium]|nr:sigma-70 family RNA polymerase sigma factor [Anaerolineales bacterium]NUQ85563.1 sigma-70 family RNA polymerase sigma factor [Anaerolineales bacterium]
MSTIELDFPKIYDAYLPKILRYLTRFIGESEAEDLTQETFIKVHQGLGNFRGESRLSTWIYRIATNTALDRMRHPSFQRVDQVSMSDEINEARISRGPGFSEGQKPPIEKGLIRDEMNDCIRGYIEQLPEDYRVVLVLSEYEGIKNSEIAEILGVSLDTVKIRLHRAKMKLKEELESHCELYWIEEMPCSVK